MFDLGKTILKNAALGFVVGAVAAFALPGVADMVGVPDAVGRMSNPLWLGSFMAVLNGATSLFQPLTDYLFGPPGQAEKGKSTGKETHVHLAVQIQQDVPHKQPETEKPSPSCCAKSVSGNAPLVFVAR